MKIIISKTQWKLIGQKTGWLKIADLSPLTLQAWVATLFRFPQQYDQCPPEIKNENIIKKSLTQGWINKLKINPELWKNVPDIIKNHPTFQNALRHAVIVGWSNKIAKNPQSLQECPEEFKSLSVA